ncbi:hypothetical protein TcYC6_0097670 [Trypanosoma cruzi]|nr:hypothetical protein TcYC6_0097670 [Trypanosoma cruzi]
MSMHRDILCEALLHAQYGRRDAPCIADFPTDVSRKEVEEVYLPFLTSEEAQLRQNLILGDVEIIGYDGGSLLAVAGDAIAAGLVLSDMLSEVPASTVFPTSVGPHSSAR